jgi:bacterioferritin-associated ferredoxin
MTKFKDLLLENAFNHSIEFPSVSVSLDSHTLTLRFDSKDILLYAGYSGPSHPWLSSLCFLIQGKSLSDLLHMTMRTWEQAFRDDQSFWDFYQEEESFFNPALELLKASIDVYRGREYLYQESSPLVCRCFGVRESDILEHLKKEEAPSLESLASLSKAGMGCRSCVPQLKRWLVIHDAKKLNHFYKEKSHADWLLEIDYMLSCFPQALDWNMEVKSFKGHNVIIGYNKSVGQVEEEITGKELQKFLGSSIDSDLGFFLKKSF